MTPSQFPPKKVLGTLSVHPYVSSFVCLSGSPIKVAYVNTIWHDLCQFTQCLNLGLTIMPPTMPHSTVLSFGYAILALRHLVEFYAHSSHAVIIHHHRHQLKQHQHRWIVVWLDRSHGTIRRHRVPSHFKVTRVPCYCSILVCVRL